MKIMLEFQQGKTRRSSVTTFNIPPVVRLLAGSSSHVDLGFFLPDVPGVEVISTSQSSRTKDMTWLEAVEVADMEPVEVAELFAQTPKLQNVRLDMEMEVALISQGPWISRARDRIGCIICGGYPAVL